MIDAKTKEAWIAALRSGTYEQTDGKLGRETPDGRRCCCALGVLLDVIDPEGWLPVGPDDGQLRRLTHELARDDRDYISGDLLPSTVQEQIADLNDAEMRCLADIADWIELNVDVCEVAA